MTFEELRALQQSNWEKLSEIEETQAQFRAALASMASTGVLDSIKETRRDAADLLEQSRRFDARMAQLLGYPRSAIDPDLERRVTELEERVERLEKSKDSDEPS